MDKSGVQETAIWAAAVWAFGIAALIAWQVVPTQKAGWEVFTQVVSVVTALATVGALWWSMRASRVQKAEQSRRELESAIVLAAGLADLLEHAIHKLYQVSAVINLMHVNQGLSKEQVNAGLDSARALLVTATNSPAFEHGFETISKLSPLPNMCATRLYKARSMVKAIQHDIEGQSGVNAWHIAAPDYKRMLLREWDQRLQHVVMYSQKVADDMKAIVAKEGVELTSEQRGLD